MSRAHDTYHGRKIRLDETMLDALEWAVSRCSSSRLDCLRLRWKQRCNLP